MFSANDFESILGRPVRQIGDKYNWQCTFHSDGSSEDHWSAFASPDGSFWCFSLACPELPPAGGGSIIDLWVWRKLGYKLSKKEKPQTFELKKAYAEAFEYYKGRTPSTLKSTKTELRTWTLLEKEFLTQAHEYLYTQLCSSEPAKDYLWKKRGIRPMPHLGYAVLNDYEGLFRIAQQLGDRKLLKKVGFVSSSDFFIIQDMILSFDLKSLYYQGKPITERGIGQYNPKGIKKQTITVGEGRMMVSEGPYKTPWLSSRAKELLGEEWGSKMLLGNPREWTEELFKPGDVFFADRDAGGEAIIKTVKAIAETSDIGIPILLPPIGFKDFDDYGRSLYERWGDVGWNIAAQWTLQLLKGV